MAEKLTKKEAVRRALAELGKDAMPVAIKDWIKKNLDIEMTAGHVSTTKGELLRKPAGTTAPAGSPAPAKKPAGIVPGGKPSKAEAVRQALAALGKKASRTDIQNFVKGLGVEMTLDHISTSKAEALRKMKVKAKAGKKAAPGKPAAAPKPAEAAPKPKTQPAANGMGAIQVDDIITLKELIDKIGAKHLQMLIAAMA